jgi:PAS domain S-box-containing protein
MATPLLPGPPGPGSAAELASAPTAVVDSRGTILSHNAAFAELFGYSGGDLPEPGLSSLLPGVEDETSLARVLAQAADSGELIETWKTRAGDSFRRPASVRRMPMGTTPLTVVTFLPPEEE